MSIKLQKAVISLNKYERCSFKVMRWLAEALFVYCCYQYTTILQFWKWNLLAENELFLLHILKCEPVGRQEANAL